MKSYLFLLLLVFISCDIEKKTDEIILKDIPHDFLKDIYKIIEECGPGNQECIFGKLRDLYFSLSHEELDEIQNFLLSPECQNDCFEIFSDIVKDDSDTEYLCDNIICTELQ